MNLLKTSCFCLAVPVLLATLTACQEDPAKQGGTYTAARHTSTGSHVPQASDINNASSVYKPLPSENSIGGTAVSPHGT